ncbi:MAG: DUF3098 domain-containing protein [Prevotella sp.]|nr:DUF3098 domain-containing protein [Candidatus Equicola faecalis]
MEKRNFAFDKINFILMAIGVVIAIIGLVLMAGGGSTDEAYDPEIFSAMRIRVAPVITFFGFVSIIVAIMYKPRKK